MTIGKSWKEYEIGGTRYYVSKYMEKYGRVWLWEYGYVYPNYCVRISNGLRSRPNLKRLFGG